MRLHIGRHCYAGDPLTDPKAERERPLTPEGVKMAKAIAAAMLDAGEIPNVIFCSPFIRAQQTADIYGRVLGVTNVLNLGDLAPWRPLTPTLASLIGVRGAERMRRVMCVGHVDNTTPTMQDLATDEKWKPLVMGEVRRVEIDRDSLEWSLQWRICPSDLGLQDYDK